MIPTSQEVLAGLAPHFGTTLADLAYFNGGRDESDGVLYVYPYKDAQRLLKIMAIPEKEQQRALFRLDERLKFVHFLGEHGAQVAYPLLAPRDVLYETLPYDGHVWVAYTMAIAPGKTPAPQTWSPDFFRNWGQMLGLLHRLTQRYPSWKGAVLPDTGEVTLTWREEWQGFYDWCQDETVREKWVELKQVLEELPVTREVFGFIHNDPHLWNLLVDGDSITLLDFDVANHHWFATDIAIACQSVLFAQTGGMDRPVYDRDKLRRFFTLFMEGYEREHHLPAEWLDWLDVFVAYRRILLFTVMYEGIRSRPESYASWKNMILMQPEVLGTFSK